jgi:uncharacterized repeat protein (TIGR03803 family)
VLYSFSGGTDGHQPQAGGLVSDAAGNLYGTTYLGGAYGQGVLFKLDATGRETVLHAFTGGSDGQNPDANLIRDAEGNLYSTAFGGMYGWGVVFKIDSSGKETVLYSFTGGTDGGTPFGGLIRDQAGNLYGTTLSGGSFVCARQSGCGTVFKLTQTGQETVLYSFQGGPDGQGPLGVVAGTAGNLYGTTEEGGGSSFCLYGCGTVFKLDRSGVETVLYSFTGQGDGLFPLAGLVGDPAGNLYGTTYLGGADGYGVVFKIDGTGNEMVLHNFTGGADGATPAASLLRDGAGNLYGTTISGGDLTCNLLGCGVVFRLDPGGVETVLHSFAGGADGVAADASLAHDSAGNLYGTTEFGGVANAGTVFEISRK